MIGLQDMRNAWYVAHQTPIQLTTIIYQGALNFRFPDRETDKLQKTKIGVDKKIVLLLPLQLLPF